jgi:hypothetical protein
MEKARKTDRQKDGEREREPISGSGKALLLKKAQSTIASRNKQIQNTSRMMKAKQAPQIWCSFVSVDFRLDHHFSRESLA